MSEHLPECIYKPENIDWPKGIKWGGSPCICPSLRACEQRVLDAIDLPAANVQYHRVGFKEGLNAAREAVDSIPPIDQRVNEGFISLVYDKGEMLAAIDELRKKP